MPITSTGIGSGLDVEGLVSQLISAERRPTEIRLDQQERLIQAELSAYGTVKSALSTLQVAVGGVRQLTTFQSRQVSSSDSESISVTAEKNAQLGNFSFEVSSLAKSHSLASTSIASQTDAVGTGKMTFRFGTTDYVPVGDTYNSFTLNPDSTTFSVDITSANNSLEGIRDEINDANSGVSAAIINDGSGYRLLLSSTTTGEANSLEVVVDDDDTNDTDTVGLSKFAFNSAATNLDQTVAAEDSAFSINGLSITDSSNSVTGVIDGISLNLKQVTTDPVDVSISRDEAAVKAAIEGFVNGFRAFNNVSNQLSRFDSATKTGNILLGDSTLRSVTSRVRSVITDRVENLSSSFSTLSEVGITTDVNGNLVIDNTKLDAAIKNNFDDISGLFAVLGRISDEDIEYSGASSDTRDGAYDVSVSQLATTGNSTGSAVLPDFGGGGTLTIDGTNDNLTLKINDIAGSEISISQGVYTTGADLALELETRINAVSEFSTAGITTTVTYDSATDTFKIASDRYGSDSTVEVTAVDASTAPSLGFTVGTGTTGVDVIGTIDGIPATGNGQSLTAASGTGAEGLALTVTGGALGPRGTLNLTRGIADRMDSVVTRMLSTDGLVDSRTTGLSASLERIKDDRAAHELRMDKIEARYRAQFGALDALVAQLQSTGSFLTSALASVPKPRSS